MFVLVREARTPVEEPKLTEAQRPPAPSAGDHIAVCARVTEMVGEPVTPDAIVKASGVKSLAALRRIEEWDPNEDMSPVRPLAKEFAGSANSPGGRATSSLGPRRVGRAAPRRGEGREGEES